MDCEQTHTNVRMPQILHIKYDDLVIAQYDRQCSFKSFQKLLIFANVSAILCDTRITSEIPETAISKFQSIYVVVFIVFFI